MVQQDNSRLVATEVGCLWVQYISDSMAQRVLEYFLRQVEDREIEVLLESAHSLARKHVDSIARIFGEEGIPVPAGFTENDVNVDAPPLYMDSFYLRYLQHSAKTALAAYGLSAALSVREDVRRFYRDCTQSALELNERAIALQLDKGIFIRAPYIPVGQPVEFVKSPTFAGSIFGAARPLNALSIMSVFPNAQTAAMARSLLLGFSQVAKSPDVRAYMVRGCDIAKKHIEVLGALLKGSDLPRPGTWESEVTDSTVAPFSDKLMMQHVAAIMAAGMANLGAGMSAETRLDVGVDYLRIMGELAAYGEDGLHIMIKHGWLEQPPQAANRKELALSR